MSKKEIATPAEPATPATFTTPALPAEPSEPSMPETAKPGYTTSEFWITLVSTVIPNLITLLAIFKIVPTEIASTLSTALVAVIGGVITIIVAIKYIKSRTEVKMKSLEIQAGARMKSLENQANAKYHQHDVEKDRAQLYLQLLQNGVIDKDKFKKEFKL